MAELGAFVGLDAHRDTIALALALALAGREEPGYRGEIKNQRRSVRRLRRYRRGRRNGPRCPRCVSRFV